MNRAKSASQLHSLSQPAGPLQLARSGSAPSKEQWSEQPRKLINQKHQLLPRTTMQIIRYGMPVNGPMGTKNAKEVSAAFPFRGYNEGCENRGVTYAQMSRLCAYAGTRMKDWKVSTLTHCSIDTWVARPVTNENNSALMEHLALKKQPPSWFISHFWGQPTADFLECVITYLNVRRVGSDTCLWVCAYAYRPHGLHNELDGAATRGRFLKAMQQARFRVLLVLDAMADSTGPGTPFARLWCAFECSMCLEQACPPLDVAAFHQGKVEIVTKDLLKHEIVMDDYFLGNGTAAKITREKTFPMSVVEAALSVNIKTAQATLPGDRHRVLNSILDRPTNSEPPEEHPKYDEINKRLRSLFALTFFHRALKEKKPPAEAARKRLERLLCTISEAIRGDEWRKSLSISVAGCLFSEDPTAEVVTRALPPNLVDLTLDLRHTGATDANLETIGARLPRGLQVFALNLSGCDLISNNGLYTLAQLLPQGITKLNLTLTGTKVTADLAAACASNSEAATDLLRNPHRPQTAETGTANIDRKAALEAMLRQNGRDGFRMDAGTKKRVLDKLGLKKDPRDAFREKHMLGSQASVGSEW
jgi:hypothetical protein